MLTSSKINCSTILARVVLVHSGFAFRFSRPKGSGGTRLSDRFKEVLGREGVDEKDRTELLLVSSASEPSSAVKQVWSPCKTVGKTVHSLPQFSWPMELS